MNKKAEYIIGTLPELLRLCNRFEICFRTIDPKTNFVYNLYEDLQGENERFAVYKFNKRDDKTQDWVMTRVCGWAPTFDSVIYSMEFYDDPDEWKIALGICLKCGTANIAHNDDGSCVED